jgi:hypothetical protein
MIKKIILWAFVVLISVIFLLSAGLQLIKPQWFLVEVPDYKNEQLALLNDNATRGEPYLKCTYTSFKEECKYVNLPRYQPYVVYTPYAPLYLYKNYLILALLVIGIKLNWEKLKEWIQQIRTSLN